MGVWLRPSATTAVLQTVERRLSDSSKNRLHKEITVALGCVVSPTRAIAVASTLVGVGLIFSDLMSWSNTEPAVARSRRVHDDRKKLDQL